MSRRRCGVATRAKSYSRSTPGSRRSDRGKSLDRRPSLPSLSQPPFSLYDFVMVTEGQVTDEQIQKWADEAEAGYDVEELKRRGRGRPGRGAEPMQVIAVRLTAEEIAALDAVAEREHLSRSEAIRRALADYAA